MNDLPPPPPPRATLQILQESAVLADNEREKQMRSFITGSRVYGTPTEKSDTDLVILTDQATVDLLCSLFGTEEDQALAKKTTQDPEYLEGLSASIKVGKLNLLLCVHEHHYDIWLRGTRQLQAIAPVTRAQAVTLFDVLRGKPGAK